MQNFWFFIEVLVGGLLSGIMYSLVALGFVLIYKASGVFNFAQGALVFFAALTFVGLQETGLPFWLALPATLVVMVLLAFIIERLVLRPLVNQPQITLFMATIGLAFFIEGLAQMLWGSTPRGLELGIQDQPFAAADAKNRTEKCDGRRGLSFALVERRGRQDHAIGHTPPRSRETRTRIARPKTVGPALRVGPAVAAAQPGRS